MSASGRKRVFAAVAVALLAAAPRAASACAVCSAGRDDETRLAFLLTTAFLSVLPLAVIGGAVWWIARRSRQAERRVLAEADSR